MRRTTAAALRYTSIVVLLALSTSAHADPSRCKAAILRNSAAFLQAKAKALNKCERDIVVGTLPPSTNCHTDPETAAAITRASDRLRAKIAASCGGGDRTCGTADDDPLASVGWAIGTCPNFENGSCVNAIGNCDDISTCLLCIGGAAVDQAIALDYHSANPSTPGTALNACQKAIGTNVTAFLRSKSKALAKCWVTVNQGLVPGPCPVPGDGKAAIAIANAESRKQAHICKLCGGADKQCNGTGDFTPSEIGFATQCPAVTVPGGSACGGPINSLQDIVSCVDCVAEFKVDCVDQLAVPWNGQGYPPECNPGAFPTSTRTSTPVATPTTTATPTVTRTATPTFTAAAASATPTASRTATPVPTATSTPSLCGNGTLDLGEDCDLSAGATCASASNTGATYTCNSCQCACPTFISFVGTSGGAGVLDTGFSGQGHDATVVDDGKVTVGVTACAGSSRPCGVCTLLGPVDNLAADAGDINSQRCTGNTRTKCNTNADCSVATGTCEYFFGSNLPLVAGGVSTCVSNQINGTITGTANVENGTAATVAKLISRVYSGPTSDGPCPKCVNDGPANDNVRAGTCDSGQNVGQTCDVNGQSPNLFWSRTSLDCPPLTGGLLAALPIDLTNTTGSVTRTVLSGSPNCRAFGFTTAKCLCDVCNNGAANPCAVNGDCPVSGRCNGGTNGGSACTVASQCPSGSCGGKPCTVGTQCDSGACTLACLGGTNNGVSCTVASQCPGGSCAGTCTTPAGICGGTNGQRCNGGVNDGAPCRVNSQCAAANCSVPGEPTKYNACADAVCDPTNTCVGGTNQNANCTDPSECPGGSCVAGNEGTCAGGPVDQFCLPNATFQGCTAVGHQCAPYNLCVGGGNAGGVCDNASACPSGTCTSKVGGTFEDCTGSKQRDCYTDNGIVGAVITATGVADPPTNDESDPTLASLFCVGPTSSGGVNTAAGLPGLGRLELPGHSTGSP